MGRVCFSSGESHKIWSLWREGGSLSDIARETGRHVGSVHGFLSSHGGIAPREPVTSAHALTIEERESISRGLAANESFRSIARAIGRAPSTVSREVHRHGGRAHYRALDAANAATRALRRAKPLVLSTNGLRRQLVMEKLELDWSPQQIAGWLRRNHPDEPKLHVSHETIYRSLYLRQRSALPKQLLQRLRTGRVMRRSKRASTAGQRRGQIVGAVPIAERPQEVATRQEAGHWEGDLIAGAKNTHVATLVERRSRWTMLVKLDGKDAESATAALVAALSNLPPTSLKTLTWDRGTELARHREVTERTGTKIYFCDPKSPWQRGTNENTNGLVRQYLPKGTRLDVVSQGELDAIAERLNRRPRKVLAYAAPVDIHCGVLH